MSEKYPHAPAVPSNEKSRIESLHALKILDTVPEERFDRLTRLAKHMFNVPIALVSLVDVNRQWFKSCQGLDASETHRDISFCGHAILGDDAFIISDATQDDRFKFNPLVTGEPHVRFYAGIPLKYIDGNKLGTLCLIDHEPREFSSNDVQALRDLADLVEQELAASTLATIDQLTQISNRRGFLTLAQKSLSLCAREDIPVAVIYLDLVDFKAINDEFGHTVGDRALCVFSEEMKSVFRDSDVFARIGGDEFVALLTKADKEKAERAVARLEKSLDVFNKKSDRGYQIKFSYGISTTQPDHSSNIKTLIEQADPKNQKKVISDSGVGFLT